MRQMNGYNFTDRVRKVLQFAREAAARLSHASVRTEHFLLAIVHEGQGVAAAVLTNLNVDLEQVAQRIESTVPKGKEAVGLDLPYAPAAKSVLECSMIEARELNHQFVGTEHLLLGLLREGKGTGAQILIVFGITLEVARNEVRRLLGEFDRKPVPETRAGTALYFITGAPGAGKTTLLKRVVADHYPSLWTGHVDAKGSPGRGTGWIELAAHPPAGSAPLLVVDGQERPHVMLQAAREARLRAFHIVLIDCDHAERRRRLLEERRQPELDERDTYCWAAYLRGQADALGLEVLDTTNQDIATSAAALARSIAQFARGAGVELN